MSQLGVFGGTFNPIHMGHLNSLPQVQKKFNLDKIFVIPTYQSPGKSLIESPTPEQRLEMVSLGLKDLDDNFELDKREIERKGESYSVETLKSIQKDYPNDEINLIIGLDQFYNFDQWKGFNDILKFSNLIVTSRPGYSFPLNKTDFPPGVQDSIEDFDGLRSLTKSGKWISFIRLNDIDISSSEIRKKLKIGQAVDKYLNLAVENYLRDQKLYEVEGPKVEDYEELTVELAKFLESKNAINTHAFDFSATGDYVVDYAIICSATNKRQSISLSDAIIEKVKEQYGVRPIAVDGKDEGRWIVLDYGSTIIHIFYDYVRQEYHLEQLWKQAKRLDFTK